MRRCNPKPKLWDVNREDDCLLVPDGAKIDWNGPANVIEAEAEPSVADGESKSGEVSQQTDTEQLRPTLKIARPVFNELMAELVQSPFRHEQGGLLIGPRDEQDFASRFVKDERGVATYASFTIDAESLNDVIRQVRREGQTCVGIVHSHPDGCARPSEGDFQFLEKIFDNPKNGSATGYFLFPIIADGAFHPFVIDTKDVRRVRLAELVIV